ncbi:MAG: penicillin-binding transpeptidase domain-containing protein, partial [Caulobacteraceae bacterium]
YMTQMMRQVLVTGSGAGARIPGYDLAGKTGTTSDYRDAWFVGFTGGFVTSVWVGKDNDTPMKAVTGGSFPARLWRTFMTSALPQLKVSAIPGGPPAPAPPSSDAIGELLGAPSANPELPAPPPPQPPDKGPPQAQGKAPAPEFF